MPSSSTFLLRLALGACLCSLTAAITICVVHDPPFTICPSAEYEGFVQEEDTIRGFDVELLRWLLYDQGFSWDPDAGYADPKYKKYSWRCGPQLSWALVARSAIGANMSSGPWPAAEPPPPPSPPQAAQPPLPLAYTGRPGAFTVLPFPCDICLGDFTMMSEPPGNVYIPYFETGAGILTLSSGSVNDPWAFVHPFHWSLWVAFLASIVIIPATVFFVERLSTDGVVMINHHGFNQWRMAQYQTFLGIFNLQVYQVVSWPAQVNIIAFCFMTLIVIQTYNAQLGALFTNAAQSSTFNSIHDLAGKKVGTYVFYVPVLQQHNPGVDIVPYRASNTDQLFSMAINALDSGEIRAFIYDVAPLVYRLSSLPNPCKYRMITEALPYRFTYAFIMHMQWNRTQVVREFYSSMWRAREKYVDQELQEKYIGSSPSCTGLASENGITFVQMSGLFIVVGAVTGAALLSGVVTMLVRIYHQMDDEEGGEDGRAAAAAGSGDSKRRKSMSKKSVGAALTRVFTNASFAQHPSRGQMSSDYGSLDPGDGFGPKSPGGGGGGGGAPHAASPRVTSPSRFSTDGAAAAAAAAGCVAGGPHRKSALAVQLNGARSLRHGLRSAASSPTSRPTSPEPQESKEGHAIPSPMLAEINGQGHTPRSASPSFIQLQLIANSEDGAPSAPSAPAGSSGDGAGLLEGLPGRPRPGTDAQR